MGILSPINSLGLNFIAENSQNLFSQITSNLPQKPLAEVNLMESLSGATAPLNELFKAIGDRLGGLDGIKNFLRGGSSTSKSSLADSFRFIDDTSSDTDQTIGFIKSTIILIANILLGVLQVATTIIKFILSFIS